MKIAIATPEEMGVCGGGPHIWKPFPTDSLRPSLIRSRISGMVQEEDGGEKEHHLVTMNRTVLDLVTHPDSKCPGPLQYEDVYIWSEGGLVPLLSLYDQNWLTHFSLGDVIDREL